MNSYTGNYSDKNMLEAVSTTVKGIIVDAFIIPDSHKHQVVSSVDNIFSVLNTGEAKALPVVVESELKSAYYQNVLQSSSAQPGGKFGEQATPEDWGDVLAQIVGDTFYINPMQYARLLSELNALMRTVAQKWGYKSRYLPTAVRHASRANKIDA